MPKYVLLITRFPLCKAAIASLNLQIASLQSEVSDLQLQVLTLHAKIAVHNWTALQEEINQLKAVKINEIYFNWAWSETGWTHNVQVTETVFNSGTLSAHNVTLHVFIYGINRTLIRAEIISIGHIVNENIYYNGNRVSHSYNFTYTD